MRVTLFFNPDAGGAASEADLRELLSRHGHTVADMVSTADDASRLLEAAGEVVVAAGGDGSVATAARVLARHHLPLAVLPMGTANNIALSLGLTGSLDDVVDRWRAARRRPFDLGRATGPWGERWFIEGVGGGLVARSISAFEAAPADPIRPRHEELIDAARMHAEVLSSLTTTRWDLTLDGEPMSGDYLLVAVLNIRLIGPNLSLCPTADPTDGKFSVVVAGEEHRGALDDLLMHRTQNREAWVGLQCHRASRVEIARGDLLHIDDQVFAWPPAARVSIQVEPGALDVLL